MKPNRVAGLLAEVGICTCAMMDQFWEMYEAYKTKKPWQTINDTEWGQSTKVVSTVKESNGQYWLQKGRGKDWLAGCVKAHIEVVGTSDPMS